MWAAKAIVNHKQRKRVSTLRREVGRELFQEQRKATERELTRVLSGHFSDQIKSIESKLRSTPEGNWTADKLINRVFDPADWYESLVDLTLPILAKYMSEAAIGYFLSIGIDIRKSKVGRTKSTATEWMESSDEELPPGIATDMPEWMQEEIGGLLKETFEQDYWEEIAGTTKGDVRVYLNHGITDGWSIDRIAKEISRAYPAEYSKQRATAIARTESGNALNGARNASYERMKQELPDEVSQHINKSWLSVLGNTTRDDHANLDGVMADEDGMWVLGGVAIPWPGHWSLPVGQRVNCMCSITTEFGAGAPSPDELENLLTDQ